MELLLGGIFGFLMGLFAWCVGENEKDKETEKTGIVIINGTAYKLTRIDNK